MTFRSGEIIDGPPPVAGLLRATAAEADALLFGFGFAADVDVTGEAATGFGVSAPVSIGSLILLLENMSSSRFGYQYIRAELLNAHHFAANCTPEFSRRWLTQESLVSAASECIVCDYVNTLAAARTVAACSGTFTFRHT